MSTASRWLDTIKSLPVTINPWMIEQVGYNNDGPYKNGYNQIAIVECGDPVVDVSDFGLVGSDFYLQQYMKGDRYLEQAVTQGLVTASAFLRQPHAERLQQVDSQLRQAGLFLHIQSGWRHPALQKVIRKEYARKFSEKDADRLFAPVKQGDTPPHSTGAAFDLEIRSLDDGVRQELYWQQGNRTFYGAPELEALLDAQPAMRADKNLMTAVENRRVLFHCLCTRGVVFDDEAQLFTPHPGECWHFGDGDPLSAFLQQAPNARYGSVTLDANT